MKIKYKAVIDTSISQKKDRKDFFEAFIDTTIQTWQQSTVHKIIKQLHLSFKTRVTDEGGVIRGKCWELRGELWGVRVEWWVISGEWWVVSDEGVSDEGQEMKGVWWEVSIERWGMRGDWQGVSD